jgi:ATP-dependent helicase/DNAse subunit B
MTFDQFAEGVLQSAVEPIHPISSLKKRVLVRCLIEEELAAGRLRHFAPIAGTSGFVDLVCEWIRELKQREIWPQHLREAYEKRGMTAKDDDLLRLYEAYQQCLLQHHLYDAEGRFWSAREVLRTGRWHLVERLRLIVADGFADFTPPQHEIFGLLAKHATEILITLPCESDSARQDLFAKPKSTFAILQQHHDHVVEEVLSRPAKARWPALAHLEGNLFLNPKSCQLATDTSGLEILTSSGSLGEIELIGSRIKRLLTEGSTQSGGIPVRPGDVAVVVRSPDAVADPVREVFHCLGIPVAIEAGLSLENSPVLARLIGLLRLDVEDWPFRQLMAVVSSNYFRPDWDEWQNGMAAVAAERVIRRFQIPRGREMLLRQLEREIAGKEGESGSPSSPRGGELIGSSMADDGEPHELDRQFQARMALGLLTRLKQIFDALPERATIDGWAQAWSELARQTGMFRLIDEPVRSMAAATCVSDPLAWERLQHGLVDCQTVAEWIGEPKELDRRAALAVLVDLLGSVRVYDRTDESGRVRVLSAESVRALDIPYLFFAGLSEHSFPRSERADRLYDESERNGLIDAGVPLAAPAERNQDEMLLFYEAMTRASERLIFSYPALDEAAQPLSPSPYLEEVERACGEGRILRTGGFDLSPIPMYDEPRTTRDFRVRAVADALDGEVSLLAGLLRTEADPAENLMAALGVARQRQDRRQFGPTEGMVQGAEGTSQIASDFGPERVISATDLERYAFCPFRFFVEKLLQLEVPEELALEPDYIGRGRLVHDALARFHDGLNRSRGGPTSPSALDESEYRRLMSEAIGAVAKGGADTPLEMALEEINRRQWLKWSQDYLRQHRVYDDLWKGYDSPPVPTWFEVSFGGAWETAPPSTEEPLQLATPLGTVRISGRIDRIDLGSTAGKTIFNVIDFKTGASQFSKDRVAAGTALQLPLYCMAITNLLMRDQDAVGCQAGYWNVGGSGFRSRQVLVMHKCEGSALEAVPEWAEIRSSAEKIVGALIRGIHRGEFPIFSADEDCTRSCPLKTICRINQIRSLGKTWQPPEA